MSVKLLTELHLESLCLKGGCTGWSESTHVKMPHCLKSHATAHFIFVHLHKASVIYQQIRPWYMFVQQIL